MKQAETVMFWTLCSDNLPGSREVNPAPDGNNRICPKPYTSKQAAAFQNENEHGDPYDGYVIVICTYPKDVFGNADFEEEMYHEEHYFEPEDYVISEDGHLIGFRATEDVVLWIKEFDCGGELEGSFGLPLRERIEVCQDWDPITDEETEYEQPVIEYGYLTHSRW